MIAGKKILFIHSSADLYGSDRCLLWLGTWLKGSKTSVEVVVPYKGPLVDKLQREGIEVHIVDPIVFRRDVMSPVGLAKMAFEVLPAVLRLRRLIKENNIDLVHTNTGVIVGGGLAAKLSGIPHIWHFREILKEFKKFWFFYEPLVRITSKQIVCISDAVASQFSSKAARKKISVVYDGVPVEAKEDLVNKKRRPGPARLLCVGRLAPYKGQDVLIEAVHILNSERGVEIELVLVGDVFGKRVQHREILEELAASLDLGDRIRFEGFQAETGSYINDSDIFVLPSKRPEGLGLVVLEAMAYGKPVIATKGGGVAEIIDDRVNGILVEPDDPVALADSIEELIRDPGLAVSLGSKGYETVSTRFSVELMNKNMEKIYERALAVQ